MNAFDWPRRLMGGAFGNLQSHFGREKLLMIRDNLFLRFGLALVPLLLTAGGASAATSFSHTLRTFTGNSTLPATQAAVSAAGFNFFDHEVMSKIDFDASGAHFGVGQVDADGRNYMRTNDSDYANVSFVAEISIVTPDIDIQDAYFGLGAGDANLDFFRVPDFGLPVAAVQYWGENEIATPTIELYTYNNGGTLESAFIDPATGLGNGTHRVRLTYDWFRKTADFSFDLNYAGGSFSADLTGPSLNTLPLYGADGFPTEPARLYFGGDEGTVFKDFQVTVSTPEMIMGDFNSSNTITAADWAILRDNMHTNLSSLTFAQAYALGDLTADKANNHEDFVLFKTLYEDANGAGSFARMLAGVPEPSSFALFLFAGLMGLTFRCKARRA
jgi:PEP-CTERM motif